MAKDKTEAIYFDPSDIRALRNLMDRHGSDDYTHEGHNLRGESVRMSIFPDKIVVITNQENRWVRKNIYYRDGTCEETFDGKWC